MGHTHVGGSTPDHDRDEHAHGDAGHDHGAHTHAAHDHAGHSHAGHSHAPASFGRAFAIGTALNVGFIVVETVFGLRVNSMALLADAGHNLSDVFGLLLAWGGAVLARRRPTARHTYGLRSTTILAALANAVFLLVAIGAIGWEAVRRFGHPEPIAGGTVAWVAGVGIAVNGITAWLFASGRKGDLNVRGAFLHMAADAAVSAGVVIAGLVITATGWLWLDPAVSLALVVIIGIGTWGLLRDSVNLALDAVPAHIDPDAVRAYFAALPGVREVHDLHIWAMSTTDVALTAHLIRPMAAPPSVPPHAPLGRTTGSATVVQEDEDLLLLRVGRELRERFDIAHPTVQIERGHGPHPCALAPEHVV